LIDFRTEHVKLEGEEEEEEKVEGEDDLKAYNLDTYDDDPADDENKGKTGISMVTFD
jgi:hypothetical protein